MGYVNKVLLMGNITRDIELKSITGGQSVARIGLAINRRFTTASGEKRDEVTFVDCEAWGKTGENIAKFFSKGRPIFIEGRLKLDQWEDKQSGAKQSKLKVVVDSFEFVDSKNDGGGGGGSAAPSRAPVAAGTRPASSDEPPAAPDDIPF